MWQVLVHKDNFDFIMLLLEIRTIVFCLLYLIVF